MEEHNRDGHPTGGNAGANPSRRWVPLLAVLAMLTPSLPYLSGLPRFGRCQYNDYYGIINLLIDGTRLTRDPVRWLKLKSNEHTVTIPALIYAANMKLTHGDNRGLSGFALLVLFLTFAVLYRLFLPTLDLPPPHSGGLASCSRPTSSTRSRPTPWSWDSPERSGSSPTSSRWLPWGCSCGRGTASRHP